MRAFWADIIEVGMQPELFRDKPPVSLNYQGASPVVVTPPDYDRFVLTQKEAVKAVVDHVASAERSRKIGEDIAAMVYRIHAWCKRHPVSSCVVAPRMDDLLVVVVARGEDEGGALHDAMAELDLEMFRANSLRLEWLLLRESESSALSAFIDPTEARTLYSAQSPAA
jgi:hypothetical protein